MAAPAPAAAAGGGIRFKVYDLNTQNTLINGVKPHPGDDLSPPFDPDAHTFRDVMAWRLDSHPDDRDRVWHVGPRALIIGIDVSLDTPLRDWVAVLDLRTDGVTPAILRPTPMLNLSVEYEKVQYALAANAAGLAWPLWDAADMDPINMQAMGAHDNLRNRRGSQGVPPEEDNGIRNLVGLRRGRHLKFVNMHALAQSLVHGNRREPAFHTEIADIESFGRHLLIAMQRSASPSQSDPKHTLLPIIDLVTGAVDRRYGSAFSAFERREKNKPLSEAAIRVANHGREQGVAAETYLARSVLDEYMRIFMLENPNTSLAGAEAEGLRLRDWIPSTRGFSDADALKIARDMHRQLNAVVLAAGRRERLTAFVRAFLRIHPGVVSAGAEHGLQKVREWIAATGDEALGQLTWLVRDEYPRALAGEQPAAVGASPKAAMATAIHAFVRSNPDISIAELEQGIQLVSKVPLADVMAIVREEQQRRERLAAFVRTFMRNHPGVMSAGAERGLQAVREWVAVTRDVSLADLAVLVRQEHPRALAGQPAPVAAAGAPVSPRDAMAAQIHAFVRGNPRISLAELEQGMQQLRDFSVADLMAVVREEQRSMQHANPAPAAAASAAAGVDENSANYRAMMAADLRINAFRAGMDIEEYRLAHPEYARVVAPVSAEVRERHGRALAGAAGAPVPAPAAAAVPHRNPLIEMYKTAFWAGGQEADPADNARAALEAIRTGGLAPGVVRAFQRMLQSASDTHVQFEDVADRDARRNAMIVAIHARYPAEDEEDEEEEKGEPAANRLAARMERQLRW